MFPVSESISTKCGDAPVIITELLAARKEIGEHIIISFFSTEEL